MCTSTLKHPRHLARKEVVFVLVIALVVGASILISVPVQPSNSAYHVNAHTGSVNWRLTTPLQPLATDYQGSIVSVEVGSNLRQLQALNPDGSVRWKMFGVNSGLAPTAYSDGGVECLLQRTNIQFDMPPLAI